jgi:rhodanese-related sulfurtransferase
LGKLKELPKMFWSQIIYPLKEKILKNIIIMGFLALFFVQGTAQTPNERPHSQSPKLDKTLRIMLHFSVPTISIDVLKNMSDMVLLDAREQKEYDVSHIPTAQYCGFDHFNPAALEGIPKDINIVVYCSIGVRSEKIAEKIKALGYTHVANLYGSLFEWVNAGHSVVDKTGNETRKVHAYNRLWSIFLDGKKAEKVW